MTVTRILSIFGQTIMVFFSKEILQKIGSTFYDVIIYFATVSKSVFRIFEIILKGTVLTVKEMTNWPIGYEFLTLNDQKCQKGWKRKFRFLNCKVECVFPVVIVFMLPLAEFQWNNHREDAPHCTQLVRKLRINQWKA